MTTVARLTDEKFRRPFKVLPDDAPDHRSNYNDRSAGYASSQFVDEKLRSRVTASMRLVETAAKSLFDMRSTLSSYESDLDSLGLEMLKLGKEKARLLDELHKASELISTETARANNAEMRANASQTRAIELEEQLNALGGQLDKLMTALTGHFG